MGKFWIILLFTLNNYEINVKADRFVLLLPNGEEITDDVIVLNDLVEQRFREYFENPLIQEKLITTYKQVAKEVPRFHELFYKKETLTKQEENEFAQLVDQVIQKYYKKILTEAFALGGIKFTLIETK